jgi:hypothetical protein
MTYWEIHTAKKGRFFGFFQGVALFEKDIHKMWGKTPKKPAYLFKTKEEAEEVCVLYNIQEATISEVSYE